MPLLQFYLGVPTGSNLALGRNLNDRWLVGQDLQAQMMMWSLKKIWGHNF